MLYEESEIRMRLGKLAWRVSGGSGETEDMLEEATVYLWSIESDWPGHSISWYLERCYHHLQDITRRGKSVDSAKRAGDLLRFCGQGPDADGDDPVERLLVAREDTFGQASADDLLAELEARLDGCNRAVLQLVLDGWAVREAAGALGISASAVQARVGTIRTTARRLGI